MGLLDVRTAIARLSRRISASISRGVVVSVDDHRKLQSVQLRGWDSEVLDDVEHFQRYGLSTHPHPGAEAVLLCAGGNRSHPLAAAIDDRRHRPQGLQAGEVMLYTDEGDTIHLQRGRIVAVTCGEEVQVTAKRAVVSASESANLTAPEVVITADTSVTLDTPAVTVTGSLTVDGDITAQGDVSDSDPTTPTLTSIRNTYNSHTGHGIGGPPGAQM